MYRIQHIQVADDLINPLLLEIQSKSIIIEVEEKKQLEEYLSKYGASLYSYIYIGPKNLIILSKHTEFRKIKYFHFTLDGSDQCMLSGSEFYGYLRLVKDKYLIPDIRNNEMDETLTNFTNRNILRTDGKYMNNQSGILEYEPSYLHKKVKVWAFDINSAYASIIYNTIPDTRSASGYYRELKKNEIGFVMGHSLTLVKEGYADVCFKLVDTPKSIKDFLQRWYNKKEHPKDGQEKIDAKSALTFCVGYMQFTNPYLRAYIVESCNNLIKELRKDSDWVLVNTDCIYSTKNIEAKLNIGKDIGMFKVETGELTISGVDYTFNEDSGKVKNVYRGRVKEAKYAVYKDENNYYQVRRLEDES